MKFIHRDDRHGPERPRSPELPVFFFCFFLKLKRINSQSRALNAVRTPAVVLAERVQMLLRSSAPRWGLVDSSLWVTGLGPGSYSPPALRLTASKAGGGGSRGISFLMTQRLADIPTVDTHLRVCFSTCGPAIALFLPLPEPTAGMEEGGERREWEKGGGGV